MRQKGKKKKSKYPRLRPGEDQLSILPEEPASGSWLGGPSRCPALQVLASSPASTNSLDAIAAPAQSTDRTLSESSATPAQSSAAPAQSSTPPAQSSAAPALSSAAPALSSAAPALSSAAPALSSAAPALSSVAPALSSAAPALSSVAPALSSATPALSSATPALSSAGTPSSTSANHTQTTCRTLAQSPAIPLQSSATLGQSPAATTAWLSPEGAPAEAKKAPRKGWRRKKQPKPCSAKTVHFASLPDKYEPLEEGGGERESKEEKKYKRKQKAKKYAKNVGKALRTGCRYLLIGFQGLANAYSSPWGVSAAVVVLAR